MNRKIVKKLVRDNIPNIINSQDDKFAKCRILSDKQYLQELHKKLIEEANEFIEADDIEELADVIEVIESIMRVKKIEWEEVKEKQKDKRIINGGFKDKIYLDYIEEKI